MQIRKRALAFIILALFIDLIESNEERTIQDYTIYPKDIVYINVDNFLPYGQFLNDLEISISSSLEIFIPQKYDKKIIQDDMDFDIFDDIIDVQTYENYIAFLHRNSNDENFIFLEKIDTQKQKNETKNIFFAPQQYLCSKIQMDKTFIFASCVSKLEKNIQFCKLEYSFENEFVPNCFGIELDLQNSEQIFFDRQIIKMHYYFDQYDQKRLFALYFQNSNFDQLQNIFYLYNEQTNSRIELDKDVIIQKIKIVSYNPTTQEAILLVLAKIGENYKELRYYKIREMLLESRTDYKVIKNHIDDFNFDQDTLIMTKQIEGKIIIYDVDLDDLSYEDFILDNVTNLRKIEMKNNFVLIEIFDETYQIDIYLLDLKNRRFFKIDDIERNEMNKQVLQNDLRQEYSQYIQRYSIASQSKLKTVLGVYGFKTYLFEFLKGLVTIFELKSFQYIAVSKKIKDFKEKEGLVQFKFGQQEYNINFQFENYSYIQQNNQNPFQVQTVWNKDFQFHLKIMGNDLNFKASLPIDYVNEVSRDLEEIDCTLIRIIYSNKKMIKICQQNYILIFKNIEFEEKLRKFAYKKISKIQMPDDLALFNVQKVAILYSKFLLLMTNDMIIYYLNLTKEKINLGKNEIAKDFKNCLFENNNLICQDYDGTFDLIKILFVENKLVFEYVKNIRNKNALLESFFIPQYDQDAILYITKDVQNNQYYLEKDKKGLKEKIITRFNFENTQIYEVFNNEYLFIEYQKDKTFKIFSLIQESIIFYPKNNIKQIKSIIDVKILKNLKQFLILYESQMGQTRLLIGKSSLYVYNRIVKDLLVNQDVRLAGTLSVQKISNNKILISIFDIMDFGFEKHFTQNILGPIYEMAHNNKKPLVKYEVNHQKMNFSVEYNALQIQEIKFEELKIKDYDDDQKYIEFNLEKEVLKNHQQGILEIVQLNNNQLKDKIIFKNRIHFESKKIIKKFSDYQIKSANQIYDFQTTQKSFSIFIKDFLYLEEQGFYNNMYKNCNFIKTSFQEQLFENFYICLNINTFEHDITNFKEISIPLKMKFDTYYNPQMIQFDDQLYIALLSQGKQTILMWKFKFDREDFTFNQEFFKIVSSNDFLLNQNIINNFAFFKPKEEKSIYLFIINKFSNTINIKKFLTEFNIFSSKNQLELFFYNQQIIEDIQFFVQNDVLISYIKSQQTIHEIEINRKNNSDKSWFLKTLNKYIYLEPENFEEKIQYTFCQNYFGVINEQAEQHKVLIYQRKPKVDQYQEIIPQQVYTSLKQPKKIKFKNIGLYDQTPFVKTELNSVLKNDKQQQESEAFLYLISFEDLKQNSTQIFKEVTLSKYSIGEMSLKIDLQKFEVQQILKFKVIYPNGEMSQLELLIEDKKNTLIIILSIVLTFLVLILFILIFFNFKVYQENMRLKKQREQDNDVSSFMDRTAMQI